MFLLRFDVNRYGHMIFLQKLLYMNIHHSLIPTPLNHGILDFLIHKCDSCEIKNKNCLFYISLKRRNSLNKREHSLIEVSNPSK